MTRGPTLLWRLALGLLLGLAAADFVGPVVPEAQAQGFGGFVSPGELARDHEDLDKITRCTSCHEPGAGVTAARCLACHETVQEQIDTRRGFHANRDEDCQGCHDDHRGRDFQLVQMHKDSFEHQGVGFALRGKPCVVAGRSESLDQLLFGQFGEIDRGGVFPIFRREARDKADVVAGVSKLAVVPTADKDLLHGVGVDVGRSREGDEDLLILGEARPGG